MKEGRFIGFQYFGGELVRFSYYFCLISVCCLPLLGLLSRMVISLLVGLLGVYVPF